MSIPFAAVRAGLALIGTVLMLALLATISAPPSSSHAESATKRACNSDVIRLGGRTYVFHKHNMSCERAKRYAHHVYESNGNWWPPKFKCSSGSNYNSGAYCFKRQGQNEHFGWHPPD